MVDHLRLTYSENPEYPDAEIRADSTTLGIFYIIYYQALPINLIFTKVLAVCKARSGCY